MTDTRTGEVTGPAGQRPVMAQLPVLDRFLPVWTGAAGATVLVWVRHRQRLRHASMLTGADATWHVRATRLIDACRCLLEIPGSRVHPVLKPSGEDQAR